MPEGPEVRITTDYLSKFINMSLISVSILSGRYTKKDIVGLKESDFPATIKDVNCKGKFIYFTLTSNDMDYYLFSTLGMSGLWSDKKTKHSRFAFNLAEENKLYFNDIRNFGTLKFVHDKKVLDKKLKSLGPDILSDHVDLQDFLNRFDKKPNKTIAECLMNQSVLSGIGNYLKAEILYCSRISPHRLVKDINEFEWESLHFNSIQQTRRSYSLGGATIATYRQPNGDEGLYNRRFAVYNQKEDLKGNKVIKETTADKRTTHWVPNIQK